MIVYTFRTNPFLKKLKKDFPKLFVFGKMNEDFEKFAELMVTQEPEVIVGIAADEHSRFEPTAINDFNGKKIIKEGYKQIKLYVPKNAHILSSDKPTNSFCNWSAYKIASFIKDEKLNTKLIFVHLKEEDYDKLNICAKQ